MSKIKITSTIKSSLDGLKKTDVFGIKEDNVIKYKDNGIDTVLTIKDDAVLLQRKSDASNLLLKFKMSSQMQSSYVFNDLNLTFKVKTKTNLLDVKRNHIKVFYDLYINEEYSDTFEYELSWED